MSVSPDGRTYRFGLREAARWHDGAPVTAEDYVFGFDNLVGGDSFGTALLAHIESVTAIGPLELEVGLGRPLSHLPALIAVGVLSPWPRHLWAEGPPTTLSDPRLVGNGPFRLEAVDGKALHLVASDTWPLPRGNVARLDFEIIRGGDAQVASLWEEGHFDLALNIGVVPEDLADTVPHSYPKAAVQYVGFTARGPLDDPRLRRALQRALRPIDDRGASVRAYGGLLPPAALGHSHDLGVERDVELAAQLLAEAGYPGGKGLRPLVLALPKENLGQIGDPATFVDAWGEIGVEVDIRRTSISTAFHQVDPDAWVMGWSADSPDPVVILETFLRAYPQLDQDEDLHAMLDRAAASTDRDERILLVRAFERAWIGERAAVKPLTYGAATAVTRPHVHGFWTSFSGAATVDALRVEHPA